MRFTPFQKGARALFEPEQTNMDTTDMRPKNKEKSMQRGNCWRNEARQSGTKEESDPLQHGLLSKKGRS